jgi:hypothetical protein
MRIFFTHRGLRSQELVCSHNMAFWQQPQLALARDAMSPWLKLDSRRVFDMIWYKKETSGLGSLCMMPSLLQQGSRFLAAISWLDLQCWIVDKTAQTTHFFWVEYYLSLQCMSVRGRQLLAVTIFYFDTASIGVFIYWQTLLRHETVQGMPIFICIWSSELGRFFIDEWTGFKGQGGVLISGISGVWPDFQEFELLQIDVTGLFPSCTVLWLKERRSEG